MVIITNENNLYNKIIINDSLVFKDIIESFTFDDPNAKFSKAFKKGKWKGKRELISSKTGIFLSGLTPNVIECLKHKNISFSLEIDKKYNKNDISVDEIIEFSQLKEKYSSFNDQLIALQFIIQEQKLIVQASTGSGKSLILYLATQLNKLAYDKKTLIITPRISLVSQLKKDFIEYTYKDMFISEIYEGSEEDEKSDIYISTFQSLFNKPASWYEQFSSILVDECHQYAAKELKNILNKSFKQDKDKLIGFTGSLPADDKIYENLTLKGLFHKIVKVNQTSQLIETNRLSKLKINVIVLNYKGKEIIKTYKNLKNLYKNEKNYLNTNLTRYKFICNLISSFDKNTLILFSSLENHGKLLFDFYNSHYNDNNSFLYYSGTDLEERERIRNFTENNDKVKIFATFSIFSTGINIKNLYNIVFVESSKSKITILQSIGRGLRTHLENKQLNIYDLVDNIDYEGMIDTMSYGNRHLLQRLKIYTEEQYPYEIYDTKEFLC